MQTGLGLCLAIRRLTDVYNIIVSQLIVWVQALHLPQGPFGTARGLFQPSTLLLPCAVSWHHLFATLLVLLKIMTALQAGCILG